MSRINFTIEYSKLDSLQQQYGQFGLDQLFITAKEAVESGGEVTITQEYTNAPAETLRTMTTPEEIERFFKQALSAEKEEPR